MDPLQDPASYPPCQPSSPISVQLTDTDDSDWCDDAEDTDPYDENGEDNVQEQAEDVDKPHDHEVKILLAFSLVG